MAYIGNIPAEKYSAFQKQDFTTSATTSYTLDNPVANANELALFINFVRQEPTTAYSASGTTLTLTSATSSSDDMYCVYLGKAVQTVNPPNASVGLSQLTASGTKDATTFLRGDNTFAVAGGTNTPAFEAYLSSDYAPSGSIGDDTDTKVPNDTEIFDTDNAYDNSTNYRFTPQVAGKYFVYASVHNKTDTNSSQATSLINIYKNGSVYKKTFINFATNYARLANIDISAVIDMNGSSDYIEIYGRIDTVVSSNRSFGSGEKRTYFGAYKILT